MPTLLKSPRKLVLDCGEEGAWDAVNALRI